jgi:hypothetical protein
VLNRVIIDTKGRNFNRGFGPVSDDPAVILTEPVCVWQPPLISVHRPARDLSDPFSRGLNYLLTVRARSGCLIVIDELREVMPADPHPLLRTIAAQGQGRPPDGKGLGVWGATQQPFGVFPQLLHDAHDLFLFRLQSSAGRGVLDANLDVQAGGRLAGLPPHQFYYWRIGMADPGGPYQLGAPKKREYRAPSDSEGAPAEAEA